MDCFLVKVFYTRHAQRIYIALHVCQLAVI